MKEKYCLLFNLKKNKSCYRIYTVPAKPFSFTHRKGLKHGGLNENETCEKYGVDGCIFVHVSGFTGGNKTLEGALQMAIHSLE